jgi:hypothetical protein
MHPELKADKNSDNYLWIEGSIRAHRYDVVRPTVDRLLLSVMGIMEVIGLLQYKYWLPSQPPQHVAIGTNDRVNSGAYLDFPIRLKQVAQP